MYHESNLPILPQTFLHPDQHRDLGISLYHWTTDLDSDGFGIVDRYFADANVSFYGKAIAVPKRSLFYLGESFGFGNHWWRHLWLVNSGG